MATSDAAMAADQDAWAKQYTAQQAAKTQAAQQPHPALAPPEPPSDAPTEPGYWQRWKSSVGRVTTSVLDSAVSAAESVKDFVSDPAINESQGMRKASDLATGAATGATNIVDSAVKGARWSGLLGEIDNGMVTGGIPIPGAAQKITDIWDHAKQHILDFRDAAAVQDPTLSDNLVQAAGQLAVPFAGYSRALSGLHGLANVVAAGALTDATALQPHDARMADLISLGRHTEGKLGDVLRTIAPDGGLINKYIEYLTDRSNEGEAEGRFKNVLDGFGVNLITTPLITAVASTLKQGVAGLRYMVDNGVGSAGSLMPAGSRATQAGQLGYHGTPNAPFDAFDNASIGSGQGAQSFGHGHYIAENIATGETYQKSLSGRMNTSAALSDAQAALKQSGGDKVRAVQQLTERAANEKDATLRQRMQNSARIIKSGNADRGAGSLLKVEIPDTHVNAMLDLDKPLEKQPEILHKIPMKDQNIFQKVLDDHGQDLSLGELTGNEFRQVVERAHNEGYLPGQGADDGNAARQASEYMNGRGIPGNKYFDNKSRITGEGTRNYVVFDGKNIKVLGKEK